jgi:hypothetical protein
MGVYDCPSHATNRSYFQNPLSIEVCDIPKKLQPEFTELQHDNFSQQLQP